MLSLRRRVLDPVGYGAILRTKWGFTVCEAGLHFKGFQSIHSAENRLKVGGAMVEAQRARRLWQ